MSVFIFKYFLLEKTLNEKYNFIIGKVSLQFAKKSLGFLET